MRLRAAYCLIRPSSINTRPRTTHPLAGEYDDVSEAALAVYRLVQESLTNIARHAGATRGTVQMTRD